MGSITDYLEDELLDHIFNAAYTPAATLYVALATADPTDAATGASMNEVANSGAYARTAITFGAASSRRVTQSGDVSFTEATGAWGTVTHWAIVDSATHGAGNVLAHGALSASRSPVSGSTFTIASGEIYVEVDAGVASNYLANILLDFAFRNQAFSAPSTYIGLVTATVTDSDTGATITEVSGGSYARVQVTANGGTAPDWNTSSSSSVDNSDAVTFPTSTADWGTCVEVVVVDSSVAATGNLLVWANITDTDFKSGDIANFAVNALTFTLA